MSDSGTVLASGNLATARRTVAGVLSQFSLLGVDERRALAMVTDAGLPPRALTEPDFPISLDQEIRIALAMCRHLRGQSPVTFLMRTRDLLTVGNLGVLGMAMRHAPNALESLKVCLAYPQLIWGHSRMLVSRREQHTVFSFSMERPQLAGVPEADIDRLVEYCLAIDLITSLRNIADLEGLGEQPARISFPFARPADWQELRNPPDCPVQFGAAEAAVAYTGQLDNRPLPLSNPILFKTYLNIAEQMSRLLAEEVSVSERVVRFLWAYSPPPKRREMADILAMSERNLTRQLGREGTSYAGLLAQVQAERARNLLRNPGLSVAEVSRRLGYSEPAAFSRAFTGWAGQSPLKWRQGLAATPAADTD